MAETLKELFDGELTTTSTTLYTVAASATVIVTEIIVANKTATDTSATIRLGNSQVIPNKTIPANDALVVKLYSTLSAGKTITGSAGASSAIDCRISGVEIT